MEIKINKEMVILLFIIILIFAFGVFYIPKIITGVSEYLQQQEIKYQQMKSQEPTNLYEYKYDLVSLGNRSDLSKITKTNNEGIGIFIGIALASWGGTAKEDKELTYTFFRKNKDGGIVLEKIPACWGVIYEDVAENEIPFVEQIEESVSRKEKWGGLNCINAGRVPYWKFHIHKGSIQSEFNLNTDN